VNFLKLFVPVVAILAIIIAIFFVFNTKNDKLNELSGPIIFFGDSITAGNGVEKPFAVIIGEELEKDTLNAGVSGETTVDALLRIQEYVISKNPSIVVLEFGANDFLQNVPFDTTAANFNEILTLLTTETEAKIIIAAVRVNPLSGKYEKLQKEVAKAYEVEFEPNIMKGILTNKELMLDSIHPNQQGHQKIADKLKKKIEKLI